MSKAETRACRHDEVDDYLGDEGHLDIIIGRRRVSRCGVFTAVSPFSLLVEVRRSW
jgi:hypothetical protein